MFYAMKSLVFDKWFSRAAEFRYLNHFRMLKKIVDVIFDYIQRIEGCDQPKR